MTIMMVTVMMTIDDQGDDRTPSTLVPSSASSIEKVKGKEYGPFFFPVHPDSVLLQRAAVWTWSRSIVHSALLQRPPLHIS